MICVINPRYFRFLRFEESDAASKKWTSVWCKHMKSPEFKNVESFQKVNHFPGSFHLGRKDRLAMNLDHMADKHGAHVFGNFHPRTYILPNDIKKLRKVWFKEDGTIDGEKLFILKPPASARGQGISVISKWSQIPKEAKVRRRKTTKPQLIVQEYISNPCLLFNGTKFDLRVYVLVTSFNPLRVYVYKNGLARFASVKYSQECDTIEDQFMHLTNYSVNKKSFKYQHNNDANSHSGHKWSLAALWSYLEKTCLSLDVQKLWDDIVDIIIKTLISCQHHVNKLIQQNSKNRYNCYELLGFDIILDNNYKPWLLEVNISPSLRSDSGMYLPCLQHFFKS